MNEKIKITFENNFPNYYELVEITQRLTMTQYAIKHYSEGIIAVLHINIDEEGILVCSTKALSDVKFSSPYFLKNFAKFIEEIEKK